jgi:hypothetical protein
MSNRYNLKRGRFVASLAPCLRATHRGPEAAPVSPAPIDPFVVPAAKVTTSGRRSQRQPRHPPGHRIRLRPARRHHGSTHATDEVAAQHKPRLLRPAHDAGAAVLPRMTSSARPGWLFRHSLHNAALLTSLTLDAEAIPTRICLRSTADHRIGQLGRAVNGASPRRRHGSRQLGRATRAPPTFRTLMALTSISLQ